MLINDKSNEDLNNESKQDYLRYDCRYASQNNIL